jgi:hypothetical protein
LRQEGGCRRKNSELQALPSYENENIGHIHTPLINERKNVRITGFVQGLP